MVQNRIVFLVGPMGSGKTYIGQSIAKELNLTFRDLDDLMETAYNLSISELFEKHGETQFRLIEAEVLRQQDFHGILACGGGTPCFHDNMSWMNEHGLSFYLRTNSELLIERLKNQHQHRPLIANKSPKALQMYIEQMLEQRAPFYEKAQVIYDQSVSSPAMLKELTKHFRFFL